MNDLVKVENEGSTELVTSTGNMILSLERLACSPDVNIDVIERIWQMQKEAIEKAAKMAFHRDLASAQAEFPEIPKRGKIERKNKEHPPKVIQTTYYELYEDIVKCCAPVLGKYGLALSFETKVNYDTNSGGGSFMISHRDGHSVESSLMLPFDFTGKNAAQAVGSAITYSKRYQAKAALNIAGTGDNTDDDGIGTSQDQWITKKEADKLHWEIETLKAAGIFIRENYDAIYNLKYAMDVEEWETAHGVWNVDFSQDDREVLWIAPTKGGIFTTKQRNIISHGGLLKLASEFKNDQGREILLGDDGESDHDINMTDTDSEDK